MHVADNGIGSANGRDSPNCKRTGRRMVPRSVSGLGRAHHELFRLYFLECLPYRETREREADNA